MIDAVASIASAISAVKPADAVRATTLGAASTAAASGGGFGQVMAQVATDAVQSLKTAEAASMTGIQGKASVQQVVEAVMSAQETLQTTLAIRDKAVAAFQEISRMAI